MGMEVELTENNLPMPIMDEGMIIIKHATNPIVTESKLNN